MANIPLKGSERTAVPGARVIAPADPAERLEVSVIVRRRAAQLMRERVQAFSSAPRPADYLSREAFAREHGADPADFARVRAFAQAQHLLVVQEHAARRTMVLSGSVAQFSAAFAVQLQQTAHAGGTYRGRTGPVHLPAELDGVVEAVLGLDNRPQAKTHFRIRPATGNIHRPGAATSASFSPPQIASLYGFPAGSGKGQVRGAHRTRRRISSGRSHRLFQRIESPFPARHGGVGGSRCQQSDRRCQWTGRRSHARCGGRRRHCACREYRRVFRAEHGRGFLDAITTAIHDTKHHPSILSISWGGPESTWTAQG